MTPKERFLAVLRHEVPDRVPATPDISNYIPCKRTGLPYWDIYFFEKIPLWRAYLNAADYFGIEAWVASCAGSPLLYADGRAEWQTEHTYHKDQDAMIAKSVVQTPDGPLTSESVCFRADPPSPTEKLIKDLSRDFKKFKWTMPFVTGIDTKKLETLRAECAKRQQAFGATVGYPGFQMWMNFVQDGVAQLSYAEMDTPEILEEWAEFDLANGTRQMELILSLKPDYILLAGSGTITLSSPALARKYAIPALKKWSAMAKKAGVPTMLHSCGKSRALVELLCDETDVDLVNPLEIAPMGDVDLAEVKGARGGRIGLMGNLHTTEVMLRGTPALVREESIKAMRAAGHGGGFILSTGDQCGRDTPDENIFALVEAAKELGVYDVATGRLPMLE